MSATYTSLKDGSWGIRVPGGASPGEMVLVTKKDGTMRQERVGRVVWSGTDRTGQKVALCTINKASGTVRASAPARGGSCRGCRGPIRDASHHRAMEGYCGDCAFDEFDM